MINNIGRFQQNPKMWLQVYWANIVLQHKPNTVTEQWSTADCHPPNAYVCAIIDKVCCLPLCSTTVGIRFRLSSLFSLQVKWESISINCTCFVFSLCYENSVPAPSYANIVPTSCYANSVPTSCYANSVPTSCYANSVLHITKTVYLLHVTQTVHFRSSFYTNIVPTSWHTNIVPAACSS